MERGPFLAARSDPTARIVPSVPLRWKANGLRGEEGRWARLVGLEPGRKEEKGEASGLLGKRKRQQAKEKEKKKIGERKKYFKYF